MLLLSSFLDDVIFDKAFDFVYIFKSLISKWYLYVFVVLVIVFIVVIICLKKPKKINQLTKTQKITYMAVISALSVVVNILDIPFPLLHLSFVATIACLGGILLGPIDGFACAFIGDLIAGIIAPKGVYSPIIGLGTGLMGLVPGVIFAYFNGKTNLKIIVSYVITFVFSSLLLNTIGLCLIYPQYYVITERLLLLPLTLTFHAINCIISILLTKVIIRISPGNKFLIDNSKRD